MNRIAKIAALLVALTTVFSFSQENISLPTEKTIVYDTVTVRRVIDSISFEALKNSQEFYSNSFYWLLSILAITIAVLGFFNMKNEKGLKIEIKNQLNSLRKELEKEIMENLNKEINELLAKERKENEKKFNSAYKKIAELYYISAENELSKVNESKDEKGKNEHWFKHLMCLASFYYALTRMSEFSDDNEDIFIGLVKKFAKEYNANMPRPDVKFFYHFLLFIEHSEKKKAIFLKDIKAIYNKILEIFDYDKIIEDIKNSEFDKERVQILLKLAEFYKDKAYLKRFNLDKP